MIKVQDLSLNELFRIDDVCDLFHLLQQDLIEDEPYSLINRQDIIDLINKTKGPIDD